jgi:hypothetical protein
MGDLSKGVTNTFFPAKKIDGAGFPRRRIQTFLELSLGSSDNTVNYFLECVLHIVDTDSRGVHRLEMATFLPTFRNDSIFGPSTSSPKNASQTPQRTLITVLYSSSSPKSSSHRHQFLKASPRTTPHNPLSQPSSPKSTSQSCSSTRTVTQL